MIMKKILYSLALCFLLANAYAQQRYAYLPEGKTVFQTSYEKLIVKYKNGLKQTELSQYITDSSLNKAGASAKWNVLDVKNIYRNKDSLVSIVSSLRNDSDVLYVNPFLIYSDGTLQGLTNQLIIRLKTSTDIDFLSSKFKELKVIAIDKNKYIDREYILTIDTKQQLDALDVADTLFETGLFDYCEPDFVKLGMFKTSDPVYNLQWGIHNTGQYNGTANADINVVNAWNIATGTGIKVAVLDEGVDLNQPDLQANLLVGYDALGLGSNGGPTGDDAHGTACAGIIAAVANNNIGVTGVAYNSKIIPVRIGTEAGGISSSNAANGINWAASSTGGNADILSCSWGGGSSSSSLNTAIANAISNGRSGKGCIVLFSSGNDNNSSINYPSNQLNVIAVGGTNPCDERFIITPTTPTNSCNYDTRLQTVLLDAGSNYGTGLAVVAPGINIATTDISGTAGFSNHTLDQGWIMFNQDYVENFDGTSAACPFTAGVMALILSVNPNLTYSQATAILESTASKVGGYNYSANLTNGTWNNEMGYGRINACAAVSAALSTLSISGDNIVCTTSNNYTIPNLPAGAIVTWSIAPAYATVNTPNAQQTTLTKVANGTITFTAAISNICGNNTVYITKQVQVGLNTPSFVVNALDYCQGSHFSALATSNNPGQTISSYNWFLDGSPQSYTGFKLTGTFPSNNNYIELSVSSANCGTSDMYYLPGLDCSGGFDFTIMPNPASNTVTITTANTATTDTTTTLASRNSMVSKTTVAVSQPLIKQVKIVDVGGRLMKQMDYSTPQQQVIIDVTTLNPGIYFVSISDGKSISYKKLLIQR